MISIIHNYIVSLLKSCNGSTNGCRTESSAHNMHKLITYFYALVGVMLSEAVAKKPLGERVSCCTHRLNITEM